MATIGQLSGAHNIGGGHYLILADVEDIVSIPKVDGETYGPITLKPGRDYITVVPVTETLEFNENDTVENGSDAYDMDVSFVIPKNHPHRLRFQNKTRNRRFVGVFVDVNGFGILIGNMAAPLRILFNRTSGDTNAARNQVLCTMQKTFAAPAPYYYGLGSGDPGEIVLPDGGFDCNALLNCHVFNDLVERVDELEEISSDISFPILYDRAREYGTSVSPMTGSISQSLTDARKGIIQKIYYQGGTEPAWPSGWVRLGNSPFVASELIIVYAEYAGGSRVEYWITKPAS